MVPVDEALRTIRDAWPSNADYLDDLKERSTGSQPIPLVPFVGAGLSVPMGFPTWRGFLTALAAECGRSREVAALLAEGRFERAAETVEQGLSPEIFNQRVRHRFGERKSNECKLQGAVLALPDLAGGAVVTTNFDRILERVFAEAGAPFEHVAWGSQVDSMRRAVAENKPFLLKVHGDAEERSGRVLTEREYDKHYASADPDGLRAQLGRVFQGRTLLFMGCSLGKDRTMDVLIEVTKQASGLEHFAILEKPASDDEFFAKQQLVGRRGILPIWYPAGRHDLIEPLLWWIAGLRPSPRVAGPELVLELPSQHKTEIRSELDLLIPYQRTTEFVGRGKELESLRSWLHSEAAISVRVVTGRGGSGKTRLAVELLEWLAGEEPQQWDCGFLSPAEMERFSGLQNLSEWRRRKPMLAVVDYAAGSAEKLRGWMEQLAAAEHEGEKLRLLLLEREASLEAGWLASVIPHGYSAAAVRASLDPPEPVRLDALTEAADRRSVLRATVEAGAALRGVEAPVVPGKGVDALFDRTIEEPRWGDPLTVMMAGLNALDTGLVPAMALGRLDLALRLADRERDRVGRFGGGASPGLMEHMAAYVAVSGGLAREDLQEAARAESEATGRVHPAGWRVLADRVAEALDGGDGAKAIEPDVIGEALLLSVWGGAEVRQGSRAVARAAKARGQQVAASVMRTAQDFCVGPTPRSEPLEWLDTLLAKAKDDLALLRQIERALPHGTLALRERALEASRMLAAALRERADADLGSRPERAAALNNLGNRLGDLGQREEAFQATDEAVRINRQLAAERPGAFLTGLAASLNNLGNSLSQLGRREEALQATEEAVRLYRQLATEQPDAFLPALAVSLSNLGIRLSALAQREDALRASEEAARLHRQLAAQRPDAFLPHLARSLNNFGNVLIELGRREEALRACDEALHIRRQLAAQRPDAFLPELASSLNNLGRMLTELARREEALQASDEAARLYRQLADRRPDSFLPSLARSLGAMGTVLWDLGSVARAAATFREGVECLRPSFLRWTKAFRPLMRHLVTNYRRLSETAGLEVDSALLGDILPLLSDDQAQSTEP